jgi:hypothetical protein
MHVRLLGGVQPRVVHGFVDRTAGISFLREDLADERSDAPLRSFSADAASTDTERLGDCGVRALSQLDLLPMNDWLSRLGSLGERWDSSARPGAPHAL